MFDTEKFWKRLGASLRSVMEDDDVLKRKLEEEKRLADGEREAGKPMSIGYSLLTGLRYGGRGKAFEPSPTCDVGLAFENGLLDSGRKLDGYEKQALARIAGEKFRDCAGAKTEADFARMAGERFLLEYISVTKR